MNDQLRMKTLVDEKFLAYPDQVVANLLVQRHARSNARMAEEIVAETGGGMQACQEGEMSRRNRIDQCLSGGHEPRSIRCIERDAITGGGLHATELHEQAVIVHASQEAHHPGIVVATEREVMRIVRALD